MMSRAVAGCAAVWSAATRPRSGCAAVWRSAYRARSGCAARWADGVPVIAGCAGVWDGGNRVVSGCAAPWQGQGERTLAGCAALWQGGDDPTPPDPPTPAPPADGVSVRVGGVEVDPIRIGVVWSRTQAAIETELELADEQYHSLPRHEGVTLEIWGYRFDFVVDGRARSESFGRHTWTLRLASPAVQLDLPWADGVEGELTGQASVIARRLAGDIPLTWSAVDWRIGPGRWIANGESPLALLQTLASAVGAAVNSSPDGGLVVAPLYPVSPPDCPSATPSAILTTTGEVITLATGEERRDGINAVTVSDGAATTKTLRLEEDEEKKSGGVTEVLVYQTPWRDDFTLTHRGNPQYAGIEPMGLENPAVEDEEIIIQNGKGQAQYPVYAIVGARWNWRNLGTPTFAESGEITVAQQDESILLLTYRTKRRRFRCREVNLTDLLVVAEDEA